MTRVLVFFVAAFLSKAFAQQYRVFPKRTMEEAAVLEWGSSAVISAIDVSIALFGPQTSDAALLEVEAPPLLAQPIHGFSEEDKIAIEEGREPELSPLENAQDMVGNVCIMTNKNHLTGVQMAKIAQKSGAAALLVVNVDNDDRPDDIYRLPKEDGYEDIDIPVGMISFNSANLLTQDSQNGSSGLPERVRLYAGDDRPFFEDIESRNPTIYLIHNLLSEDECNSIIRQAKGKVQPPSKPSDLEFVADPDKLHGVKRTVLWQGALQLPARKAIEDRIEQVTGFPSQYFSDFVVDEMEKGSYWDAQYDIFPSLIPVASMVIFLTEGDGGDIVYRDTKGDPIRIRPRKGTAVLQHNTNDRSEIERRVKRGTLPVLGDDGPMYLATKYCFHAPLSNARRLAVPALAVPFGGKLPSLVVSLYDSLIDRFGLDSGTQYFEKICIFVPVLIILLIAQAISDKMTKGKSKGKEKQAKEKKS